ncbi:ABC transporter permease DevC [Planktothrix agardhii]|uniref:ABC transporter permease DevC n=1 Tax=Planktothrix agardhii TaxID=1160 RepID=UPI000408170E|nr:ABC transporter permease DevC [Planktothrix agardhii]CAD0226687.1 DevC protein [Planktothrix agardhii]CAD5951938.1 DevC protein [Planktothrix agardhii]
MMGFIQRLTNRTPLGWLQLSHDKARMLVALSGIAFADVLIFMQLGFQTALYDSNTRLHNHLDADIFIISPQARNLVNLSTLPRRRLYQAMDVPGVKSAESLYVNFSDWKNPKTGKKTAILVIGFDPRQSAFNLPEVQQNLEVIKLPDQVLFDRSSRGDYQEVIDKVDQGEIVSTELEKRTLKIAGLFKVGASFAADGTLITSDRNFLRLFPRRKPGGISAGIIKIEPGYDVQKVATDLQNYLPKDVKVLTNEQFLAFEKDYWSKNTAIGFVFSLGTAMGFVVGVIIVYQVLATDVSDHTPEYATFKAMGFRNAYLLGIVFEEAIILAIMGFIPGATISLGLYRLTRQATNLPLYMTLFRAVQVLILTIIMCMLSGAIATRKLQAADPADIF